MKRAKPLRVRDAVEIEYTERHWKLLEKLRSKARAAMEVLPGSLLVGSVARGDVHEGSDVDIALLDPRPPSVVEEALIGKGFEVEGREIVQATPLSSPKLYVLLPENVKVSVPLCRLTRLEEEFYRFAGSISLAELKLGKRVPGVNKKLLAIVPTPKGHVEFSVLGREVEVARLLGVSQDVVRERVEMLLRRDERGRSGLYLRIEVPPWESVEEAVRRIAQKNLAFRRKVRGWAI